MQFLSYLVFLLSIFTANYALPLNINLGAYSPALVVGDGEISFGGKQDVTNLMNALEGAAVNAASGNTNSGNTNTSVQAKAVAAIGAPDQESPVTVPPAQASAIADQAPSTTSPPAGRPVNDIEPRIRNKNMARNIGLEPSTEASSEVDDSNEATKRDLAGFDRALNYATVALKTSPGVELGTGAEGSGVGIKVAPGVDNTPAKLTVAKPAGKRGKVTRMYVRSVIKADAMAAEVKARDVPQNEDIDAVNLNLEGRDLLMAIVEENTDADV